MLFRLPAAARMTATQTLRSVLSALSVPETLSQQRRLKGTIPLTRSLCGPPTPLGRVTGRPRQHASSNETITIAPFAAWAAPKLFIRVFHSLSSPAPLLFHPAADPLWFRRTSIWLTTGWTMIWGRCSQRKRGGFKRILTDPEGKRRLHLQLLEIRTIT